MAPSMARLLLLLGALLLLALAAADALDERATVSVTTADGEERELSAAEFERLARARHAEQQQLQADGEQWRRDQRMEDVAREDPALARLIRVARRALGGLQRLGHAPEDVVLAGFSERQAPPDADGLEGELRVALELQAAPPKGRKGRRLEFEVDVLLDAQRRLWVLSAWELEGGARVNQLRVDGVEAARRVQRSAKVTYLLLGGGFLLIAGGALVLYGSRPPRWAKAKEARERAEALKKQQRGQGKLKGAANSQWAMDDKKTQ